MKKIKSLLLILLSTSFSLFGITPQEEKEVKKELEEIGHAIEEDIKQGSFEYTFSNISSKGSGTAITITITPAQIPGSKKESKQTISLYPGQKKTVKLNPTLVKKVEVNALGNTKTIQLFNKNETWKIKAECGPQIIRTLNILE